ncbi:MAG: glycosyltransferase family 39 protein [Uliginosibacterium sp.]|nr:glycosyltransferase family 39 protein [Uliginosibacterium sp.]
MGYAHYPYGQLPLTVVRAAAELSQRISGWGGFVQYGGIHVVGRAFSATVDLMTLLALFLLGRLAWSRKVGVLAAGFYAVAVLPIQLSHFWTVDTSASLFATVALIFLVRLARFGERGDAAAFGAAYGLALASKVSLLPMVACLPLALYFAPRQPGTRFAQWLQCYLLPGLLAGVGAWLTFRIASPYAFSSALWSDFLPRTEFIAQLFESRRLASGAVDIPPNWQWLGRQAWVWPGMQLLVWGLGLPLGMAALAALARLGWRLRRPTPVQRGRAMIVLWCLAYFLWMGQQWVATMRYFLPIYPLLCLLVAAWLYPWWRARPSAAQGLLGRRLSSARPLAVGGVVVLASVVWALAFHSVHRTIHPYLASTHWVLRNVAGAVSATLAVPAGNAMQINWPARGEYGDGIPPRVAAATLAPVSGVITALRVPHLRIQPDAGVPVIFARILSAQGSVLATTRPHTLASTAQDAELALVEPLDLQGASAISSRLKSAVVALRSKERELRTKVPGTMSCRRVCPGCR